MTGSFAAIWALSLLNPGLLGFLGLASIPIIIYLINRHRFQRVPWAAMEFLLAAMRKNRRRLQLENLLLLLVRVLVVVLLVLAMTRPLLESGALPISTPSKSELFVIDRSYSMGFQDGSRSALFAAREEVKRALKQLEKTDRMGLVLAGGFPEVVTNDATFMTREEVESAIEQIEGVELVYEPLEVAVTLEALADWIETQRNRGTAAAWQIHFYTDLQRKDWLAAEDPTIENSGGDPAIRDALDRLKELDGHLVVHPLGPPRPRNATVEGLSCSSQLLVVDLPTSFHVRATNHSREDLAGLEVELYVNGEVQGSKQISLGPGQTLESSFPYVFRQPGQVRVSAKLRSDGLDEDNVMHAVFDVRESVEVLIADGTLGRLESESEGSWLRAALTMEGSARNVRLTPYDARTIPAKDLSLTSLNEVDVLVLTNVPTISELESEAIEKFLKGGGGVLAFVGSQVNPASYAQNAYRNGDGWFPYLPEAPIYDRERETYFHWEILAKEHPALRYLAATPRAGMSDVPIHGFVPTRTALPEEAVLMVLTNSQKTPALVEHFFGDGTVLALNVGADRQYSEFPVSPAYLVFLHETLPYLTSRQDVQRNLRVQEPFAMTVPAEKYAARVFLINPDGTGHPVNLTEIEEDNSAFRLDIEPQQKPGIYEVRFGDEADSRGDRSRSEWFAVNGDPREGVLIRVSGEELKDVYPETLLYFLDDAQGARGEEIPQPPRGGELWRTLLWAVLALLAVESVMARFFGRGKIG